jgi:hypothetical protein
MSLWPTAANLAADVTIAMRDFGNICFDQLATVMFVYGSITFLAILAIAETWRGGGKVKYVIISSICMAVAAVVGVMPASSLPQVNRTPSTSTIIEESTLRGLLCRIDRRCPPTNLTVREAPKEPIYPED